VEGARDWWCWPNGLPYLAIDIQREGETCLILEYREEFPPRRAPGEMKSWCDETDGPDKEPFRWREYRFPWPTTEAEAEAMAEQMGWNEHPPVRARARRGETKAC
jgi:hypothetical protein